MGGSMAEQLNKMATSKEDAFEESSGPIIYMADNRMPAIVEFKSTIIYIIYLALIIVILLILPGVRKTKFKSFFCLITLLTVGASILLALGGSHWLTGRVVYLRHLRYSSIRSSETISGQLEVNIGLSSVNVTLSGTIDTTAADQSSTGSSSSNNNQYVMYNERFSWADPKGMFNEHTSALERGLPYPILTVTEYLSQDAGGFNWSRRLREAGHFTSIVLYAALLFWLMTTISMCVLPNSLGALMLITGLLMISAVGVYTALVPSSDSLAIRMMDGQLVKFVWSFNCITTLLVGLSTVCAGFILFLLQERSDPNEQFTIMESERYTKNRKALYDKQVSMKQIASMNSRLGSSRTTFRRDVATAAAAASVAAAVNDNNGDGGDDDDDNRAAAKTTSTTTPTAATIGFKVATNNRRHENGNSQQQQQQQLAASPD